MENGKVVISFLYVLSLLVAHVDSLDTEVKELEPEDDDAAFKRFEDKIVAFMKNVRKQVFPFLSRAAYDVALTPNCTKSLTKLYNELVTLKGWALQMLDSGGKIPSGLLKGSMMMLGNYDQCLDIVAPPAKSRNDILFVGKYCLTFLYVPDALLVRLHEFSAGKLRNSSSSQRFKELFDLMSKYKFDGNIVHVRFGICIPSTCSEGDLRSILEYGLTDSGVTAEIRKCEIKGHYHFTVEQILILSVFGVIAATVVIATFCDAFFDNTGEKRPGLRDSKAFHILLNFSASRNTKRLFSEDFEEEKLFSFPCFRGVSVTLFCFYMVVNSYAIVDEHAVRNFSSSINYFSMLKEPLFAVIANSMIFVDVIFGMAGYLLFYSQSTSQCCKQNSIKATVVKSIFRYVLPILASVGVFLILPVFGDGPAFHEVLDAPLATCRRNWWTNILFFSNLLKLENQCMLHTWILGCLIQLLLIGLAFKWFIKRFPKLGFGCLIILTVACNMYLGISVVQERLPPAMSMYFIFSIQTVKKVTEQMFFLPHAHIGPMTVGMCASYWIHRQQDFRLRGPKKYLGCATVIILLCCLVFGLYPYHDGTEMSDAALGLYSGLQGVVVSVVLVIALRIDSNMISRALSSQYFLPLRKLVYHAYLLHWTVLLFHIAISRERQYLNHYEQISRSFSHILATFFLAFMFNILFNGIFTLDEAIPPGLRNSVSGSENVSCFKSIFGRKKFHVQSVKVYEVSEDFAMHCRKHNSRET